MPIHTKTVTIKPCDTTLKVEVEFDHTPAEPPSRDMEYPGCSEEVIITSVTHDGVEILDYLHYNTIQEIEYHLLGKPGY